ncbi:hypothetical protein, partial [Photobacterium damselae]|uniref:hypothetical protein n=1 Tax=Photobacterium damselae TaxID=38293 RepID=UPI001EFEC294
ILHLLSLPEIFNVVGNNIFFIYSSTVNIKQFETIKVKLNELTAPETGVILRDQFGLKRFTHSEINQIYEKSEGIITKLEQIMLFLENSSAQEVLSQDDIFDDTFHTESIPSTIIKQIELLINDPDKELTFRMLKILSILKNGETLSNLRKDKMGIKLSPKNTTELIKLELANTLYIDRNTTIVRINPIVKDYILSKIDIEEKFKIANAYLQVSVIETKNGVKLNSINRKIYDHGYNTEEDNTNTLLKYAIQECKNNDDSSDELNKRRLSKLLYLSRAYVYILSNSSRFNETISAVNNLIDIVKDVDEDNIYKYYYQIAYAHRMMSNYDEANYFIQMSAKYCPSNDKKTSESIYIEKLYLLKEKNLEESVCFAKNNKDCYHRNSSAYIASETIIASSKNKTRSARIKALEKIEKRARKLGYDTLSNNILFDLNKERNDIEKVNKLNLVIKTDNSAYNVCRAIIYKNEVLVRNQSFDMIKESDVEKLINVYNYLFRQKFDSLFDKCHSILWEIAEYRKNKELILIIFYTGTIVWKLNEDVENEEKYKNRFSRLEELDTIPLIGSIS